MLEAQQHAGAVMGRCLQRLGHIFVAAAVAKWADTVQQARRATADAAHAQALADLEAASKLSLLDSQALRAQIELQKREKAGRVVQYCLNRITCLARVEAWDRWLEVHQAMARAGRMMDRALCRLEQNALVCGWSKWRTWCIIRVEFPLSCVLCFLLSSSFDQTRCWRRSSVRGR